jgi:hypothetical protein
LLKALWTAWSKENLALYPPVPPKVRPIIVTRWVRTHPEWSGWKDWTVAGAIDCDSRTVLWMVPEEKTDRVHPSILDAVTAQQDIARYVCSGYQFGTIEYPDRGFHLQWRIM